MHVHMHVYMYVYLYFVFVFVLVLVLVFVFLFVFVFVGRTLHMCSDVCVGHNLARAIWAKHTACFLSLPCPAVCLVATDHPQVLGTHQVLVFSLSVGCCCSCRAGTVDRGGFLTVSYGGAGGVYPVGGVVVLVGFARVTSGPVVLGGLCPCYQLTRRSFPTLHNACLWPG